MRPITEAPRIRFKSQDSSTAHLLAPRGLKDALDIAIPLAIKPEDTNESLREAASAAYTQALVDNPHLGEHPTLRARVRFMQESLGYPDEKIARLLGITANQVARKDLRARRIDESGKFEERLNNGVAIASILNIGSREAADPLVAKRVALHLKNGKLSDFSIFQALEAGFGNIAVAIAQDTLRQNREVMGQQRGSW